jgi:hypothetical protein
MERPCECARDRQALAPTANRQPAGQCETQPVSAGRSNCSCRRAFMIGKEHRLIRDCGSMAPAIAPALANIELHSKSPGTWPLSASPKRQKPSVPSAPSSRDDSQDQTVIGQVSQMKVPWEAQAMRVGVAGSDGPLRPNIRRPHAGKYRSRCRPHSQDRGPRLNTARRMRRASTTVRSARPAARARSSRFSRSRPFRANAPATLCRP